MKFKLTLLARSCFFMGAIFQLHSQGYIIANGVVTDFVSGEVSVLHNPANPSNGGYTGFSLNPVNANTFQFNPVVDIGVRVFFVSLNDPITANTVLSGNYAELTYPNSYIFYNGSPFYVGLYTGNMTYAPPNGIYTDPLFGWAELENVNGTIDLLGGGLEYGGEGIYAGTQNIIQAVPEPNSFCLFGLSGLFLSWRYRKARAL